MITTISIQSTIATSVTAATIEAIVNVSSFLSRDGQLVI